MDSQLWRGTEAERRQFIESPEELIKYAGVYPIHEQVAELEYVCDLVRRARDIKAEVNAWKSCQVEDLGRLIDPIYARTTTRANVMLHQRNLAMLSAIRASIPKDISALYIIGAADVVGAFGILRTIESEGYAWDLV